MTYPISHTDSLSTTVAERPAVRLLGPGDDITRRLAGGKAVGLAELSRAADPPVEIAIPCWFVVPVDVLKAHVSGDAVSPELRCRLQDALSSISNGDDTTFAVRSSSPDEDGDAQSMAGQFESVLNVRPGEVPMQVARVWNSVPALSGETVSRPAVIVQEMVDATHAGVAFSADPVTGSRSVAVVSATEGTGDSLVDGTDDGATVRVDPGGLVLQKTGHAETNGHTDLLSDDLARHVAALCRSAETVRGAPQDIEWATDGETLFLLQSRPITALPENPFPPQSPNDAPSSSREPVRLWDNSNIAESYTGVTTPLTFSFARRAYTAVYRAFCRVTGVPESTLDAHEDTFSSMIGLIRGRIYYNLQSWYTTISLLPGFRTNRRFMEDMMGVRDTLPADLLPQNDTPASWTERLRDTATLLRSVRRLVQWHRRMPERIHSFRQNLDAELGRVPSNLDALSLSELADLYRSLDANLLSAWTVPIVNDFLTMLFSGASKSVMEKWTGDASLHARMMTSTEPIISAEPARRIRHMAEHAAGHDALVNALQDGDASAVADLLPTHPELAQQYGNYLDRFGDRCLGELKLESPTLIDDPAPLLRAIGAHARRMEQGDPSARSPTDTLADARRDFADAFRGRPVRRRIATWLLNHARQRATDRETLRFDRTRVFGTVRRITRAMGRRLTESGGLSNPGDVFYLEMGELLNWIRGTASCDDLAALSDARRADIERYDRQPAPPDRFITRGAVGTSALIPTGPGAATAGDASGPERTGLGCSAGTVRGPVRLVTDPHNETLRDGEILVASRTDPGWVSLFAACRGLIVAHGNQLSHAAIVAREMGLPAVTGLPSAMDWLDTGDWVELDGQTGTVRKIDAPA